MSNEDELERLRAEVETLRAGFADEARIIEAQALSLSPRQLGKGRRVIVEAQVRRMYGVALGLNGPRYQHHQWRRNAEEGLARVGG